MLKRRQKSASLAVIVSRLFDPVWIIPALLAAAVVWSLYNGLRWRFVLLLLLIDGFIPFLYFLHELQTGEISDWDTTKRSQRIRLYGFAVAVHAVGVTLAVVLGKIVLSKILFSFWLLALIFCIITLRWKISLHTGVAAAAATFLWLSFGSGWAVLYLVVLLVGWARVKMGKHTAVQAAAGAVIATLVVWGTFSLFRLKRSEVLAPSQGGYFAIHEGIQ